MFAGTPTILGAESTTVTVNVCGAEVFPAASCAEHDTVVAGPTAKVDPDGGVHDTGTEPSTSSNADAENDTDAPLALVAGTVIGPGTDTTGAV
jgi:hypothetical protein